MGHDWISEPTQLVTQFQVVTTFGSESLDFSDPGQRATVES